MASKIYGAETILERHRQHFEVDADIMKRCGEVGLIFSGISSRGGFGDVCEMQDGAFQLGAVYRPQFQSKARAANPLFVAFVKAVLE